MWRILILLVVLWRAFCFYKNWKLFKLSRQLKIDAISLPLIGHAYKFVGSSEDQMNAFFYMGRQALKYDGMTAAWVGDLLFVTVADPVAGECVLKTFLEKSDIVQKIMRAVIGNGSAFAPVNIWRPRRKILAPNFSQKNLNNFVDVFANQSSLMVEHLKSKAAAGSFPVWSYITSYTMDSVAETAMGIKVDAQKNHNHPYLKIFQVGINLVAARLISPWQYNDTVYKLFPSSHTLRKCQDYGENFIDDIIKSKRKLMEEQHKNVTDDTNTTVTKHDSLKTFMDLFMDPGDSKGYSDLEVREEVTVLMMAGTDTSAVGSAFSALMLSRYPDVQERVFNELSEVFGDSKRPVTAEDLPRLKYLDAVIRETLRLYPPGPVILRQCDQDYTLPSGVTLIKGCVLAINIWAIHRNPEYWGDDAEEFRPERFLDTPFKHPAQFMPFSYGPRNCVGYQYAMMSMKTAIATLMRSYRLLPGTPTAPGGQHKPLRLKFDIMMKDVDGFVIQLQHR